MQKKSKIRFEHPKVVVGSTLAALAYAYKHNLPLMSAALEHPHPLERFEPFAAFPSELSHITNVDFVSPNGTQTFGPRKIKVWNYLWFDLAMRGMILGGDRCNFVSVSKNEMRVSTNSKPFFVNYDELVLFSKQNTRGIQSRSSVVSNESQVLDYFQTRESSNVPYDFLDTDSSFLSRVWFIPRPKTAQAKDFLAISELSKEEEQEFEFGEVAARYRMRDLLKELNLRYMPKFEHMERARVQKTVFHYTNVASVTCPNLTEEEILCE